MDAPWSNFAAASNCMKQLVTVSYRAKLLYSAPTVSSRVYLLDNYKLVRNRPCSLLAFIIRFIVYCYNSVKVVRISYS